MNDSYSHLSFQLIGDAQQQYDKREVENCNKILQKRWGLADV